MKKVFSFLILSLFTSLTFAEILSGKDGNISWNLNTDTGILTLSGTGAGTMKDYSAYTAPWVDACYSASVVELVINSGVKSIGKNAFNGCYNLTSATLPEGLTSIGANAFENCGLMKVVVLPNGLTSIGSNAFINCVGLCLVVNNSSLSIKKGSTGYGSVARYAMTVTTSSRIQKVDGCWMYHSTDGMNYVAAYTGIASEVTVPKCYGIMAYAFQDCRVLTSITLPEALISIGDYAFMNCQELRVVDMPSSVMNIGKDAFSSCQELSSITLSSSLTTIEENAFANCSSLTSITIPSGVTTIGQSAFEGCYNLTSVTLSEGVKSLGYRAFASCPNLESITLPSTLTCISGYALSDCSKLKSITLPASLTTIDEKAFLDCSSLRVVVNNSDLEIGNGSTSNGCVGNYAQWVIDGDDDSFEEGEDGFWFRYVKGKKYICAYTGASSQPQAPACDGVYAKAFANYTDLVSISFAPGMTSIGDQAFSGCTNLKGITCEDTTPPTCGEGVFNNVSKTACVLTVPAGSVNAYKAAKGWKEFSQIVESENGSGTVHVATSTADLNGDGKVDVEDVTFLVGLILSEDDYDVSDVTLLVSLILSDQNPQNSIAVNKTALNLAASASSGSVKVKCDDSWTVTSLASWLTATPNSGSGDGEVTVNATANSTGAARTGKLIFKSGLARITLNVTQE